MVYRALLGMRRLVRPPTAEQTVDEDPRKPGVRNSVLVLGSRALADELSRTLTDRAVWTDTQQPATIHLGFNPRSLGYSVFHTYGGQPATVPRLVVAFPEMQAMGHDNPIEALEPGRVEAMVATADEPPPIVYLTGKEGLEAQIAAVEALGLITVRPLTEGTP